MSYYPMVMMHDVWLREMQYAVDAATACSGKTQRADV